MNNYSRSRILALVCSFVTATFGVIVCTLWLARDVAAVTTDQVAAPAPLASRLCLGTPNVFTYPLTTTLDICDTFGPRLSATGAYSHYDFHLGVNWCADENTPVHAVTTGTVQSFDGDCASGTASCFVHLIHTSIDGQTRYDHLAAVSVTNGITVTPGQIIGWVGSDTATSSSYLHFEVHDGLTVTQRAAIHPLTSPFLPWTNRVSPTVALRGVYTDATGMTALVQVTSPYTEPDVITVSVTVSGTVTDSLTIDYVDLNATATADADLDDPLINSVCIIPADLNATNGYSVRVTGVTMAFRQLDHGSPATVTAQALDVDGWGSTETTALIGGLEVTPPEQAAGGKLGQPVTFVYTLTNRSGVSDTFTLTHLSAQGWPSVVTPATRTLGNDQSVTVTLQVTVSANRAGAPDCGLLVATAAQTGSQQIVAGFYRLSRIIPPTGVSIGGPVEGNVNTAHAFTADVSPTTATVPITYTWQATGQTEAVTSTNTLSHTVLFTWTTPGAQVITVTVTNAGGTVSDTHAITINAPPNGVDISGPAAGNINTVHIFTADVSPPTATVPITYYWQATGQNDVETSTNGLSHTVSFTWTTPGSHAITVTVTNAGGVVTDTHAITINVPPADVSISGPSTGIINAAYTFTATVSPPTATLPITYYWQATGSSLQTHIVNNVTDTISFTWSALGSQTITVTVTNAGGAVSSTHAITITAADFPFYDGFESGALGGGWSVITTDYGRVRASSDYAPHSGTYHILLDSEVTTPTNSYAAIILNIDIEGQSGVVLDFWWQKFFDDNPGDGVFISDDDGDNWYQVLSFATIITSYQHETIHLDEEADVNGLDFNDHFQIKFQFYDNLPIPSGGYAVDDVWVRTVPVEGVDIGGPTTGNINTPYTFTATVSPPTATLPISYTWSPAPTMGQGHAIVTYTWQITGLQTITVTATNVSALISDTHAIIINVPLTNVVIDGSSTGIVNAAYTFTATVSPPTTTLPITYYWQATGLFSQTRIVSNVTDTISFTWNALGSQTVTVTAANAGGTVSSTHAITITAADFPFYDGFESGALGGGWSVITTAQGRVQVSDTYPHSGTYSVLLDEAVNNIPSTAAIILHVNLNGQSGVVLDFWWREFLDEDDPADGVFISDDDGENWYQVLSFNGNHGASFQHESIHLDAKAAAYNLTFNNHFQIKFQFYGRFPIDWNGYAIDNVWVRTVPIEGVEISGPTTGNINTPYTFTATVSPPTATLPISYTWSPAPTLGQGSATVTYNWPATGPQTIVVTATNVSGSASDTHTVTIGAPVEDVDITGPTTGNVNTSYTFAATVSPLTATLPIAYTWSPEPATGQGSATATYDWPVTGLHTIIVTATNAGGSASDTHAITINVPPTGVDISGRAMGVIQVDYAFIANVSPITTTTPITYVWQATEQGTLTHTGRGLSDTVSFNWDITGTKTITVAARNVGGMVIDTHIITLGISPLTSLTVSAPLTSVAFVPTPFSATVGPITATLPVTYTWEATNQAASSVIHGGGGLNDIVTFTWKITGAQAITVTAINVGGTLTDTRVITILSATPPGSVAITGPTEGIVQFDHTFTATVSPITTTAIITYVWRATDNLSETHMNDLDDTVDFAWDTPGVKTITVTAMNPVGMVSQTHVITTCISPLTGVDVSGPGKGLVQTGYLFTATVSPITATVPITYYWQATGQSDVVTSANALSHSVLFAWDAPGAKAITVTTTNAGDTVSDTHSITINVPLTEVDLSGPTVGNVDTPYAFTADISPLTATVPITYHWQATGQSDVVTSTNAPSHTVLFAWNTSGPQAITLTAANVGSNVTNTHVITINVPPTGVDISGPATGNVNTSYTFTATVSPPTATLPIVYTWSPEPTLGQGSATVTYTWSVTGMHTIDVTATNVGGSASDTHTISIGTPVEDVDITGPTMGSVNTSYTFTATVSPPTATPPIVYTWSPEPTLGQGSAVVIYTWPAAGAHTIIVTATNAGGSVSDTHAITIRAPVEDVDISGPTAGTVNTSYTFTAAVSPPTATPPIAYTWSPEPTLGQGSATVTYTWPATGPQTIVVTATNAGGSASDTHTVTIGAPVEDVDITGPTTGNVNTSYTFSAAVSPPTATLPIVYAWSPEPATGQGSATVAYNWPAAGLHTIIVTATNAGGSGSDTHAITIRVPVEEVEITGPTAGNVNTSYTFTATVSPPTATPPIVYTWSPEPTMGQGSALVEYAWSTTGTHAISVTATNAGGMAVGAHVVTVEAHIVYLPLTIRNWPPVPDVPTWGVISPPDGNTSYVIRWNVANWAETYVLQEATNSDFSDAVTIYTGAATFHTVASRCIERYYYRVSACNGWGCSNWSAATSVEVRWECEPNDPYAYADGPLTSGVNYYGYPDDGNDYFFFEPDTQGQITIDLTNHTGQGVQLLLYYHQVLPPAEGRCIVGSSGQCQIVYPGGNPPDRYYVRIYTESGYNNSPYTLRVTFPQAQNLRRDKRRTLSPR